MLVEFSIIPVGSTLHLGDQIAEVLKVVDASGLAYELTPGGTCVEGEWDAVMDLLKRCRERACQLSSRVIWLIKIDDERGAYDMLTRHVLSVEEKVGHALRRPAPPTRSG